MFNESIEEQIVLKSVKDPFKSGVQIMKELEVNCTPQTVNKLLRKNRLFSRHSASKPKVVEDQRHKRIEFAIYYQDFDWKECIFADESCFSTEKREIKLVKRTKGARFDPKYTNYPNRPHQKTASF